ncbi:hypothetical protein [Lysobacter silvisoli]|uniref:Uncharacterized protein n=1 Tax=Lysobacter silvisoli TaxID=2293254 RepID=A0A371K2X0_9GAMM|nr:hypothetical protein [Lysobacter silvisoli]RDZ28266.1 hypothetical protein DX914_03725 [Lysobacter silvisoli]
MSMNLPMTAVSDAALVTRMYDLVRAGDGDALEMMQLDAAIYGRLAEAYGETIPELEAAPRIENRWAA